MGIHGLSKFIRVKYSNAITCHHLSEFAYKILAIDVSVYLYKYIAVCSKDDSEVSSRCKWLEIFIQLIGILRKNNIHCIFIYDGKSPEEKRIVQQERREGIRKRKEKADQLFTDFQILKAGGDLTPLLEKFMNKNVKYGKRLLIGGYDFPLIEKAVTKYKNQNTPEITEKEINLTKRLFTILKIPFCTAPQEAEAMCSKLCIDDKVFGVLSEDTDIMVYGTPNFLFSIDTRAETCLMIENKALLSEMNFTRKQFVDFCIMCGTDYNKNIRGVGPANAYKLITEYGNIEAIQKEKGIDISILNHKRGRVLFNNPVGKKIQVPYTGKPNYEKLEEFVIVNNIIISIETIKEYFTPNKLIIIENEEEENE